MTANLISRFGRERARKSLGSSFAQFQADKAVVGLARQITKNEQAVKSLRGEASCHLGDISEYMERRAAIKELENQFSQRRVVSGSRRKAHAAIEEEISEHRRFLKHHPCHPCPDRESHARQFEKAARLERESQGLTNRMESRTNVIPRTFDRVGDVLTDLNYLHGDSLTPKGEILTRIYAETDLLMAEILNSEILNDITPPDLVGLLSSLVYEGRGERSRTPRLPKSLEQLVPPVAKMWATIVNLEESHGIQPQREPNFDLAWSAYRWANGHSLQTILRETEITVGDFVRAIRQIIDLLGQLLNAKPDMHHLIRDAMKRVDRGVIAYSAVVA
jgi:ATP-dependent RNA helicase HelY